MNKNVPRVVRISISATAEECYRWS